jgi:hypothetical protein
MRGHIGVDSAPDSGSTFWFTVVLPRSAPTTEITASTRAFAQLKDELLGKRVLVVDDNATNRRILLHQCSGWGMVPDLQRADWTSEDGVVLSGRNGERGDAEDVALFWQQWALRTPSLEQVAAAVRAASAQTLRRRVEE